MAAKLFALLVMTAALAVPALALADDAPTPAAAACKAEYLQLGPDAFKAKYGPSEPYGNCLAAHGQTSTPAPAPPPKPSTDPKPAPPATSPAALCTAEYQQLGADAFKAKYGPTEPYGNCLSAKAGAVKATPPAPAPAAAEPKTKPGPDLKAKAAATVAQALCSAEGRSLGKDAFQAKYGKGKDGLAACVRAALPQARSILAGCKTATGEGALKQCVTAALKTAGAR